MSESESNPGADRRAVIAGVAAAAGAASPLLAGAAQAQPPGALRKAPVTTIKVDLGGVRLPEAIAGELEQSIRRAALNALGQAGVKGTELPHGLNPIWRGIIYRPEFIPAEER